MTKVPCAFFHSFTAAVLAVACPPLMTLAAPRDSAVNVGPAPREFVPATSTQQPFWQYAIFGGAIGLSNVLVGPVPIDGSAREIIIGGNSGQNSSDNDYWHSIRYNATTANYEDVFVSPLYPLNYGGTIRRIALGNVTGDANPEIAVMLDNGSIVLYDFVTKAELSVLNTGLSGPSALCLADLDGDGLAEILVTAASDLFVFNGAGTLLWQVAGAGGLDIVAGQMDEDPAMEIATASGKVVDATTHTIQWSYANGFGNTVRLAPYPGKRYQQLIAANVATYIYSFDVATQLPRWSIYAQYGIAALQIADVDSDEKPDLIFVDGQWGSVHVYNLVTQAEKWSITNPENGTLDIAVGDVDDDGVVDLLWGGGQSVSGGRHFYVAETTGAHAIKWQSVDLVGPFLGPVIGDLDGDGQPEMVVCSFRSDGFTSGRIVVFDLATLTVRGVSEPVVSSASALGVKDLKLRDLENDGRMEIVIGADVNYNCAIEIYSFDASNTFTLKWSNTARPVVSAFYKVEVADLDNNGTPEIIGGTAGSVLIFDYPATDNPWQSVNLGSGWVDGLIVQDLDRNGARELVALTTNADLYTWDGPTRQLVSLNSEPGAILLSTRPKPSGLILGDVYGFAHFLQYRNNTYSEKLELSLGSPLTGINVIRDGLWSGTDGVLTLRTGTKYSTIAWQSPVIGTGFGTFVATDKRNGENRVFSSSQYTVTGFTYPP